MYTVVRRGLRRRRGPRTGRRAERAAGPHPVTERPAMHEIRVTVVSPEEASYGTAEFWSGGRMIGFTRLEDGDLTFRMEPRRDGAAVVVGAQSLAAAIAEANRLLALY
jgi:hypothetical protein